MSEENYNCTVTTFTTRHTNYFILNLVIPRKGFGQWYRTMPPSIHGMLWQIAPISEIKVMKTTPTFPHDRQILLQKLIKSSELLYKKLPFSLLEPGLLSSSPSSLPLPDDSVQRQYTTTSEVKKMILIGSFYMKSALQYIALSLTMLQSFHCSIPHLKTFLFIFIIFCLFFWFSWPLLLFACQ